MCILSNTEQYRTSTLHLQAVHAQGTTFYHKAFEQIN